MYSKDYIQRAVGYKDSGHTFKELAEAFCIPNQTYYLWKRKLESGYYQTKGKQQRKRKIDRKKLKEKIAEQPDIYLHELVDIFDCSAQAISAALKDMGITRKKKL